MMKFDLKGITVEATAEMLSKVFKDANNAIKTRLERDVKLEVYFWLFSISNGDLYALAFVKSTLQFFMQCYWKHHSKPGMKIELSKVLYRQDELCGQQSLSFYACQKANQYTLSISFQSGGKTLNEVFLDAQEVIMLDIAIGKAISLLAPDTMMAPKQDFTVI